MDSSVKFLSLFKKIKVFEIFLDIVNELKRDKEIERQRYLAVGVLITAVVSAIGAGWAYSKGWFGGAKEDNQKNK